MSKYINADELKDNITAQFGTRYEMSCFDIVSTIMDFPSADVVEVKRGEWRVEMEYGMEFYICSECGIETPNRYNFCPNCGADMRGEMK